MCLGKTWRRREGKVPELSLANTDPAVVMCPLLEEETAGRRQTWERAAE